METTPLPENRRAIPKHWIVLGLLVAAHAGVGAWLNPVGNHWTETAAFIFAGFIFSQPILLAFWAAFSSQPFYLRFLWSLFLCIMVAFAVDCGMLLRTKDQLGILTLVDPMFFIMAAFIFVLIRRLSRWQIELYGTKVVSTGYRAYQFGIKHLIILITITAIGFGLFRSLFLMASSFPLPPPLEFAAIITAYLVVLLPVIVLAWSVLASLRNAIFFIVGGLILLVIVDFIVISIASSFSSEFRNMEFILFFQLGAALSVLLTTLVMRWCSFRMIRMRRTATPAVEP
jgi:hypothetical protein